MGVVSDHDIDEVVRVCPNFGALRVAICTTSRYKGLPGVPVLGMAVTVMVPLEKGLIGADREIVSAIGGYRERVRLLEAGDVGHI